jgi:integrase
MAVKAEHIAGDRWRVRVYAGWDPVTRKQRQRSRTFRANGEREANRLAAKYESELRAEVTEQKKKAGTMADLVERWQAARTERTHSPATLYREQIMVDRILERFGTRQLDTITGRDIDEFYTWLRTLGRQKGSKKRPLSESTIHHHHRILRSILRTGERWDMVDKVATARANPPKPAKPDVRPPTLNAFTVLYRSLPDNLKIPILILAGTGIRRGELFGLTWGDVNLDAGRLWVQRSRLDVPGQAGRDKGTKTGQGRSVPLDAGMVALLDRWQRELHREYGVHGPGVRVVPDLTTDPTGMTPMRPGWLSLAWRRHCTKHGVVRSGSSTTVVRLHDLRHMYVTWLLDSGTPINTVQGYAGHHDPSVTTGIYGHGTDRGEAIAVKAIGELVAAFTTPATKETPE